MRKQHLREADRLVGVADEPAQPRCLQRLVGVGGDQTLDGGDEQDPLQRLTGRDPEGRFVARRGEDGQGRVVLEDGESAS